MSEGGSKWDSQKYEKLSLDEYIRQKGMDQLSLLNIRKKDRKDIDEDELNSNIDEYMQQNEVARSEEDKLNANIDEYMLKKGNVQVTKFNRASMRDDSDDELDKTLVASDSDVDMNGLGTIKEDIRDDSDDSDFGFQTVEQRYGIRVRQQQWRLLPENNIIRPKGVPRLEFLPLEEHERYKYGKVLDGKVRKQYRKRNNSKSSGLSRASSKTSIGSGQSKVGSFVEKGSFTYKFADRNGDGSQEGIIGIERAKRNVKALPAQWVSGGSSNAAPSQPSAAMSANVASPQPINVNINLGGIIEGLSQHVENGKDTDFMTEPEVALHQPQVSSNISAAAARLLAVLKANRDKNKKKLLNLAVQNDLVQMQGRDIIFEDRSGVRK